MSTAKQAPKVVSALAALALGCSAGSLSATESDWDWDIALYAWMPSIDNKVLVNDRQIGEIDLSFSDLIDKLDMTLMLHGEGFRDRWGFFADYLYLDISDKDKRDGATIRSEMTANIFELAGVYRPSGTPEGFEAFAGLRYFSLDVKLDVDSAVVNESARVDNSYTDFMVGGRYTGRINENWFYRLRADASGGDTEGTWNLVGAAGYQFGKELDKTVLFGYRHFEIDIEEDQGPLTVRNDLQISGPFVAFNFAF